MEKQPNLERLGKRIKELRLSKNLTQFELAARLGKDHSSIARIEAGRINPSYLYLLELSKGLDIDIKAFFD
jgi:putative transcriptional regulator